MTEPESDFLEDDQQFRLNPRGHLASLLHRRYGVSVTDGSEVWDVLVSRLVHDARQQWPDCDAAAVVLLDGGDVIPLFKAAEPEIQDSESGAE